MRLEGIYTKLIIDDEEYLEIIKDILDNEKIQSMKEFVQHGNTSTFDHCVAVSYKSYLLAKKFKLDYKSVARAGLLHDMYLYDWHTNPEKMPLFKKHGFTHPLRALNNAKKYFELNDKEIDIIVKHMWPLTLFHIPRYRESYIVTIVDKKLSTDETFAPLFTKTKSLLTIKK